MQEKKSITISVKSLLLVIAIIVIGIMGYFMYKQSVSIMELNQKVENLNYQTENEKISNSSENVVNKNSIEAEKGKNLNNDDTIVKSLINKISFPTYATASIYNASSFDVNTIPNDLILRLGWSKISENSKKLLEGETKQTVTKEIMMNSIQNIFGSEVVYTDSSFTNIDVETFDGYNENKGTIMYSNNIYTADYVQGGGFPAPFIYQELEKAVEYSDRIEIYVKTAFVDTFPYGDNYDCSYRIYSGFSGSQFEGELLETKSEEFDKVFSDESSNEEIILESNPAIAGIKDELNSYVYTFKLDNSGDYYLSGFNKAK